MKTAKDYLDEANAVVRKIEFDRAIEKHKSKSAVFIDVRDSSDIAKTGTITDALKIQRGLIEFVADDRALLRRRRSVQGQPAGLLLMCYRFDMHRKRRAVERHVFHRELKPP